MSDFFLADDLSGALDAAAAFHAAGWRVTVALTTAAWSRGGDEEMIGFTTETRNAAPLVAAEAVARAITHGRANGGRLVYKKIDSTLRGPVAAEVAALARESPGLRVLFAPANPSVGRTVRDGVLLVHGVPVSDTEFGRDAVSPVSESVIRRLLGDAATDRVVIADAATEADLATAVARMDAAGKAWVGVGSGALARPIAARITKEKTWQSGDWSRGGGKGRVSEEMGEGEHSPSPSRDRNEPMAAGFLSPVPMRLSTAPCLMVCGSAHAVNREQAAILSHDRSVPFHELRPGGGSVPIGATIADVRSHGGAALLIEAKRHRDSTRVVRSVASAAAEIMTATTARRVFVTGGETAFALCPLLGVTTLTFLAEIEPGLSLSSAETSNGRIWFAIKPGGFGDARTWVRAWDALQQVR